MYRKGEQTGREVRRDKLKTGVTPFQTLLFVISEGEEVRRQPSWSRTFGFGSPQVWLGRAPSDLPTMQAEKVLLGQGKEQS